MLAHLSQAARLTVEAVAPILALEAPLAALSCPEAAALAADPRGDRSLMALGCRRNCARRSRRRRLEPDRQASEHSAGDQSRQQRPFSQK